MRISQRLGVVLALGLGAVIVSLLRSERQRNSEDEKVQTKERLNVWDNEGGNIPNVQTVRPSPDDPTSLH